VSTAPSDVVYHRRRPVLGDRLASLQKTPQYATNRIEQWLLLATVALFPMQEQIAVGGFSVMYLLFAAQAAYVIAKCPDCFAQTWLHPLLLAVYVFLCIGFVMEMTHPGSTYTEIYRMMQTFVGGIFVASVCRDRKALQSAMYGYLIVGAFTSIILFRSSYGALSGATAIDYGEADRVRDEVFAESPLQWNLNGLAFVTAQGTGVALALALTTLSRWRRYVFLAIALGCFVATFLPMSRSGVAILLGVCASVVLSYGIGRIKTVMIAVVIGAVMLTLVPGAVFSRLSFSTEADQWGRMEGRAAVYTAFFHHLPEVVISGVGAGNFWGAWGRQSQFSSGRAVAGAHNIFFQMTIYWGLPALLGLFGIIYQAYRCLPGRYRNDPLAMGILCIAVSLLLWSLTVHNLYDKTFGLGVGLLAGAHYWIWSKPSMSARSPRRRLSTAWKQQR
jgi:hypothetical protein